MEKLPMQLKECLFSGTATTANRKVKGGKHLLPLAGLEACRTGARLVGEGEIGQRTVRHPATSRNNVWPSAQHGELASGLVTKTLLMMISWSCQLGNRPRQGDEDKTLIAVQRGKEKSPELAVPTLADLREVEVYAAA